MAVVKGKAGYKKIKEYLEKCLESVKNDMIPIKDLPWKKQLFQDRSGCHFLCTMKYHQHEEMHSSNPDTTSRLELTASTSLESVYFPTEMIPNTLIPFVKQMEKTLGAQIRKDHLQMRDMKNEENYLWLEKEGRIPYIKPLTYEKWKKRKLEERNRSS